MTPLGIFPIHTERHQLRDRCGRPDRHTPLLRCGYPRPCPYHDVDVVEIRPADTEEAGRIARELLDGGTGNGSAA